MVSLAADFAHLLQLTLRLSTKSVLPFGNICAGRFQVGAGCVCENMYAQLGLSDVLQALAGLSNSCTINVNDGWSIVRSFYKNLGTVNIDGTSRLVVSTLTPMGGQGMKHKWNQQYGAPNDPMPSLTRGHRLLGATVGTVNPQIAVCDGGHGAVG